MHLHKFPTPEPFPGDLKTNPPTSEFVLGEGLFGDFPSFDFKIQETMNGFSNYEELVGSPSWCQNLTPQQPCVSATMDSSSICAGSPTSTIKPKAGDNQGCGSSEEEDAETEIGQYEQSNDPVDKRKASNRESARRSRTRKQAELQGLEMQVEHLNGENVTLSQQMNDACQKLKDATTNYRVLKSYVEALRAKVKLAEEMVTRGSLSCSFNQFLQTHLGSTQLPNSNLSWLTNMSPTFAIQDQDAAFGAALQGINNENVDPILNWNAGTELGNEDVNCVKNIWPGQPGVYQ